MEVVIRTVHGSADVELTSWDGDTTLGELLLAVTGPPVPRIVVVDDRPCRVDDALDAVIDRLGLGVGSVIDIAGDRGRSGHPGPVLDDGPGDASTPLVRLRQLSGRGTGEIVDLPAGRFRFGAGPRFADGELVRSTVGHEAFTVGVTAPLPEPTDSADPLAPTPPRLVAPPDDAPPIVTVRPHADTIDGLGAHAPMLDGEPFDRELPWASQRLTVGGRAFDLVPPAEPCDADDNPIGAARIGPTDRRGTRSFDAAGSTAVLLDGRTVPTEPVIAAAARVADPTRILWRRLPNHERLAVPVGLTADSRGTVTIDLDRHGGVALTGSNDFTAGLARTIVLELATELGPGDLDIAVVASAGRLGRWDWCKWLPHVRGGDPTRPPRFLTTDDEAAAWFASIADDLGTARSTPPLRHGLGGWDPPAHRLPAAGPSAVGSLPAPVGRPHPRPSAEPSVRRTLLIVDDPAYWARPGSPLRDLLVGPHAAVRVIATADRPDDAPGSCTAVVDEIPPRDLLGDQPPDGGVAATQLLGSLCRVEERLGNNAVVTTEVHPAIADTSLTTRLVRSIAAYDDLRLGRTDDEPGEPEPERPTVAELVTASSPRAVPDGTTRAAVAVGALVDPATGSSQGPGCDAPRPRGVAMVDIADAGVTLVAVDAPHDRSVVAAVTLGMAARHAADDLAILLVADAEPCWIEPLPHAIGTVDGRDTEQLGRVLRRVAAGLSSDRDVELLVVVADGVADEGPPRLTDAATAFLELATSLDRVHLVLSTAAEHGPMVRRHLDTACGACLEGHPDGTATLTRRNDGLHVGSARIMPTADVVLPVDITPPPPPPAEGLRVRPFAFGRPLTPVERRIAHPASGPAASGEPADPAVAVGDGGAAGIPAPSRNRWLPTPFPERVGQETLVDAPHPRRTEALLSLGIVDRLDDDRRGVYRWTPHAGSLVAVGHRRSGIAVLGDVVAAALTGIDADVWVLDPLPQRRRAFRRLPHCRATADPDSAASVERFLADVERDVAHRRGGAEPQSAIDGVADAVRGGPRPAVVVIGDLDRALAPFDEDARPGVVARLAAIARRTPTSPVITADDGLPAVALVVAAADHEGIAPLLDDAADVLIGALDDGAPPGLGVPARPLGGTATAPVPGRCWSNAHQRLVQLATPPEQLERFVRHRTSIEAAAGRGAADGAPDPIR